MERNCGGDPLGRLVVKWRDEAARQAAIGDTRASVALSAAAGELEAVIRTAAPLTTAEVAFRYGISEHTVCEYAKSGRLVPAEKVGNRWRFGRDVRLAVDRRENEPAVHVVAQADHGECLSALVKRRLRERNE